jgi:hypothetical protein
MIGRRSTYSTGYVQGIVTYTITDSLQVTPMSTNSVIHRFNTEHFSTLHGMIVLLGYCRIVEYDCIDTGSVFTMSLLGCLYSSTKLGD